MTVKFKSVSMNFFNWNLECMQFYYFRCKIAKTVTFDEALETMQSLEDIRIGKVVLKLY